MKYRKNIRLKEYDYTANGYYFVTICTYYGKSYLEIDELKRIASRELEHLNRLQGVKVDYYIIMPTHIHFILILENAEYKLSALIGGLKSKISVSALGLIGYNKLWQPNYYEHVIRTDDALNKIREYIIYNPQIEKPSWRDFEKQMPLSLLL